MVRISNLELVKVLLKNARVKFVDLAKKFGVSETAIRKRIKILEDNGTIKGYTADVDPKKLGFNIDALIGVDTEPEYFIQVLEDLKKDEKVLDLYSASGDHMIMFRSWFENSIGLAEFIKKLEKVEGITKICPAIILEKIK